MGSQFKNAIFASIMAGIIVAPVFGLQIVRQGMTSTIQPEWDMILYGMLAVFLFQMVRPIFGRALGGRTKKVSLPTLTDKGRRIIISILIAIALVWPFFTSRVKSTSLHWY